MPGLRFMLGEYREHLRSCLFCRTVIHGNYTNNYLIIIHSYSDLMLLMISENALHFYIMFYI